MKNITLISTAVLLMTFTSVSMAQIYKWVDKNGQLHYTQRPAPAGNKAEDIEDKIRLAAVLARKNSAKQKGSSYLQPQEEKTAEEGKKELQLRDEIASKQKAAEDNYREQLENYCNAQRTNLKQLQSSSPIAWQENGKTTLLSADQKRAKIQTISQSIQKNCSVNTSSSDEEE